MVVPMSDVLQNLSSVVKIVTFSKLDCVLFARRPGRPFFYNLFDSSLSNPIVLADALISEHHPRGSY
jgi:hypothetical protein